MTEPVDAGANAPLCPTCGYSLLGLTEYRCPECGEAFDAEYVEDGSFRANLLPWERPETGAVLRRLGRTLVQATFHPDQFFARVSLRKDRPIAHAGRLVTASPLLSVGLFLLSSLFYDAIFFLREVLKHKRPAQAFETIMRFASTTWSTDLQICLGFVSWLLLSIMGIAALIKWRFGGKIGCLHWIDLVAVFSPAVAIGAFIAACSLLAVAVFRSTTIFVIGFYLAPTAVVLLLLWFGCRRLLLLSRLMSVSMLLLGLVVKFGALCAVTAVPKLLMLW